MRLLVRFIGLISTVILARLLLPEDFGLIALASALIFVLESMSDLRFELAIIAQQETSDDDLNSAFTLNVLRGVGLAVLVSLIAFPYAGLMDEQDLAAPMLALSLLPLIDGFKNPAFIIYEKSMVFSREFTLQLSHKLFTLVVTITFAILWRDHWALVAGLIAGSLARTSTSYLLRPFRPRPTLRAWRRLAAFSGWLMAANVVTALLQKMEFFLIGAMLPVRTVGIYHVGSEIAHMAAHELAMPLKRAIFPALSSLADDPGKQYASFLRSIEMIALISLPAGIGLALVAEPFTLLVLGDNWTDVIEVLVFLGPAGSIWAIAGLCDTLTLSRGKTRMIFNRELVKALYMAPIYFVAVWFGGLRGLLVAVPIVAIISLLVYLHMVKRQTGKPMLLPLLGAWRSMLAVAVMSVALVAMSRWLGSPEPALPPAVMLLTLVTAGATIYIASHLVLWLIAGRPDGVERFLIDFVNSRRHGKQPANP